MLHGFEGLGTIPSWDEPRDTDLLIRQSTISSWRLCPARVGLSTEPGFVDFPNEGRTFGSTVHYHIEAVLAHFMAGNDDRTFPIQYAQIEALLASADEVAEDNGFTWGGLGVTQDKLVAWLDEVRFAVRSWHENVWLPHFEKDLELVVERTLMSPLGIIHDPDSDGYHGPCDLQCRGVWLHGTPDLYASGTLHDWKTAKRGWRTNRDDEHQGQFSPQAPLYLWLWEQETGERIRDFTFWVFNRSSGEWERYDTHWTDDQIEASRHDAWQVARSIDAQAFPFTPAASTFGKYERGWWCSPDYCGAWNICPGKGMMSDGSDLDRRIPTSW